MDRLCCARMKATGPLLMLAALALALVALPDLLLRPAPQPHSGATVPSRLGDRPGAFARPDPALRPLALLDDGLIERLSEADQAWIPRAEPLPDGGLRYLYKRRPGDPELSVAQVEALIADPPSLAAEQRRIVDLLTSLERAGAAVALEEPIKAGAAAEWDPRARTLRIRPDVIDQGSLEFARVLNHEAVHVAQSCAAGSVGASPRPLGVRPPVGSSPGGPLRSAAAIDPLNDPVYADLSPAERRMEAEAYSLQNSLGVGRSLIEIHCSVGGAA
jgi:hypothetical protein